ncbi:MAG: Flp pilus assembly complex ATPase component TadA, partial [Nanoarchaeota archaeon]|nr:Flp pilus assembly complex ATPase component TadA [Nanoarchaeota archaeon]
MTDKGKNIIDILISKGLITKAQSDEAVKQQQTAGLPLQKILIEKGFVSDENLALSIAAQLDVPYIKLSDKDIDPQAVKMIPEDMARRYKAVPVRIEDENLYVAFVSPLNLPARDEMKHITGLEIKPMVSTEKEIDRALNQYYKVEEVSKQALIDMRMQKFKKQKIDMPEKKEKWSDRTGELPIVKLVNDIINGAVNAKASDIHLEPQEPEMVVRYRVDGILHDIMTIPAHIIPSVVSRVKILANLDITKQRIPQDGHITLRSDGKDYDLRVSTLMTVAGEKVVLRVLDRGSMMIDLGTLGFVPEDEKGFRGLIDKPYGMILVTGPTGSGKTTTL